MRADWQFNALWQPRPETGKRGARTLSPDAAKARSRQIKLGRQVSQPGKL